MMTFDDEFILCHDFPAGVSRCHVTCRYSILHFVLAVGDVFSQSSKEIPCQWSLLLLRQ